MTEPRTLSLHVPDRAIPVLVLVSCAFLLGAIVPSLWAKDAQTALAACEASS